MNPRIGIPNEGAHAVDHEAIRRYYGQILTKSSDLQTDACCTSEAPPEFLKQALRDIHPEVLERYYGCGLVLPEALDGATILDLGCGAGRDAYLLAKWVGSTGRVIGLDMTSEQIEIARRHQAWHAERYNFANTEFKQGFVEDLSFLPDASVDIVVSNCVVNLSPDKPRVLREAFRVLKPGGELYFSDVYADRRLPDEALRDEVLWGECLAGALYWNDFLGLAREAGFTDPRLVKDRILSIDNPALARRLEPARFWSATWRLWKLEGLERLCEDYGQVVRYKGGIPRHETRWSLDHHHTFERGQSLKVCGNTWRMLHDTRFAPWFEFLGDFTTHFGIFPDCGTAAPFSSRHDASGSHACGPTGCC